MCVCVKVCVRERERESVCFKISYFYIVYLCMFFVLLKHFSV